MIDQIKNIIKHNEPSEETAQHIINIVLENAASTADTHTNMVNNERHNDLVARGYYNAAFNISYSIRSGKRKGQVT